MLLKICVVKTRKQKMSVNFNPAISTKAASAVNLKKTGIERSNESPQNPGVNPPEENNDSIKTPLFLTPDLATAAELAARASIIMAQEYGVPPEIAKSAETAEDFYEKALDIADKIQDTIDEIQATYEKGSITAADNTPLTEILQTNDGKEIMLEYGPDGTVLRKSTFKDGMLKEAEEFLPDGKKNVFTLHNGEIQTYEEELVEYGEDTEKPGKTMKKYFTFNDGTPSMYFEDYAEFEDGSSESSKWLWFNAKGKMDAYYEDIESDGEGNSTVGLHLRYNDSNELYLYIENIQGGKPQGRHFELIDDKWTDKSLSAPKTAGK